MIPYRTVVVSDHQRTVSLSMTIRGSADTSDGSWAGAPGQDPWYQLEGRGLGSQGLMLASMGAGACRRNRLATSVNEHARFDHHHEHGSKTDS